MKGTAITDIATLKGQPLSARDVFGIFKELDYMPAFCLDNYQDLAPEIMGLYRGDYLMRIVSREVWDREMDPLIMESINRVFKLLGLKAPWGDK